MLELHHIDLSLKDKAHLKKLFANGDKINYAEASALLVIDLEQAGLDEKKWTVQRAKPQNAETASKITAKALARLTEDTNSEQAAPVEQSVRSKAASTAPSQVAKRVELQQI